MPKSSSLTKWRDFPRDPSTQMPSARHFFHQRETVALLTPTLEAISRIVRSPSDNSKVESRNVV